MKPTPNPTPAAPAPVSPELLRSMAQAYDNRFAKRPRPPRKYRD